MKLAKFSIFLFLIILLNDISYACPYCPKKKEEETKNKFKLDFSLGMDLRKGNTDKFTLNSGVDIKYRILTAVHTLAEIRVDSDYYIDLVNNEVTTNKFYTELLFYYYLRENWSFFIYTRPSNNSAQKLIFRIENGIGAKYDFLQNIYDDPELTNEVSLSAAMVYDIHEFSKSDLKIPEDKVLSELEEYLLSGSSARISLRAKCSLEIIKNMRFMFQVFWQPSISNLDSIEGDFGEDYRILIKSEFKYSISSSLSFDLKFNAEYNSMFPEGLKNWDWTLINGVTIRLAM